jgi:hypothetical protein
MGGKKRVTEVEDSDEDRMSEDDKSEDEAIKSDNEDEDSMKVEKENETKKMMKLDDMFKVGQRSSLVDIEKGKKPAAKTESTKTENVNDDSARKEENAASFAKNLPWVEKYRPSDLEDLVSQGHIISTGNLKILLNVIVVKFENLLKQTDFLTFFSTDLLELVKHPQS